ncbi:SymE family type I addiction module toxin [Chitinophaga sp. RAB17]|uniref:SymE family type I addiction module toxin n=1 Tax=Chitinophaga sp. RAB17 TaxID=3233049 RepID=UPI003F913BA2
MNNQLNDRKAKLHYKSAPRVYEYKKVPWINLSGLWLEKAGFDIGDSITISVNEGALTIRVASKAPKVKAFWED